MALDKTAEFIGKAAAAEHRAEGGKLRLVNFVVDARDADVIGGDEPIRKDGEVVGWVTSGGYAHASGVSVAMGYVPRELAGGEDSGWQVELLGELLDARPQRQPPLFDPDGARMRGG